MIHVQSIIIEDQIFKDLQVIQMSEVLTLNDDRSWM